MHNKRNLDIATGMIGFAGYLTLATTPDYSPAILFIPIILGVLAPMGESIDRRTQFYGYLTNMLIAVAVLWLASVFTAIGLLFAVTYLVMLIHAYCMVHEKSPSRYGYIFLMSFFMVAASTVLSPRAEFAFAFILFVTASMWMLMQLEYFRASQDVERLPAIRTRATTNFTNPRFELDEASSTVHLGRVLVVAVTFAFLLSGFLFTTIPRTEAGVFGAALNEETYTTGVSESVDLSQPGTIENDASPAMQVTFPEYPGGRYPEDMFWRVRSLDQYTGTGWDVREIRRSRAYFPQNRERYMVMQANTGSPRHISRTPVFEESRTVRQVIFLPDAPTGRLPALDRVLAVSVQESGDDVKVRWDSSGDYAVELTDGVKSGAVIDVVSEVIEHDPDELRNLKLDYGFMSEAEYRLLTYEDLLPRNRELTLEVTKDATNYYDRVVAIETYLSSAEFAYTRSVPPLPNANAVDYFLENVKEGHCEIFASTMALMTRSLGLPTRLVTGFRGADWDPESEAYVIPNDRAHLWVEVLFPTAGWVTFDPSPMDTTLRDEPIRNFSKRVYSAILRARMAWIRNVISYQPGTSSMLAGKLTITVPQFLADATEAADLGSRDRLSIPIPLVLLIVFGGGFGWYLSRGRKRKRRASHIALTDDQRRARALYRGLRRKLQVSGVSCVGLSVEEVLDAAQEHDMTDPETIRVVLNEYQRVRFGGRELSAERAKTLRGSFEKAAAKRPASTTE